MPQISFTNEFALAGLLRTFTPFDSETVNMQPNENLYKIPTLGLAYNSNTSNSSTNEEDSTYANRYDPKMVLMKGVPPTQGELSGVISRNSDILITFSPQSLTNRDMWVNDGSTPSIYLQSTDLAYATASGTASWIWWYTRGQGGTSYNSIPFMQAVFTVGTFGSGADFEMPTTDIVSGRGYKLINGPRLTMATEINY
jgi:hypothetical protein